MNLFKINFGLLTITIVIFCCMSLTTGAKNKHQSDMKMKKCGDLCSRALCMDKTPDQCRRGEVFLSKDGDCYCCDSCIPRDTKEKPVDKKKKCGDLCSRVLCVNNPSPKHCDKSQVFIPRDDDCRCCNSCVFKDNKEKPVKVKKCGNLCELVDCVTKTPKQCTDSEDFVPKDGDCQCCDSCVPKENKIIVKPIKGNKCGTRCHTVRCAPQTEDQCGLNEVLVKADHDCICCDRCMLKVKNCGNYCHTVRCAPQSEDECTADEVLVKADHDCFCCDRCINKDILPIKVVKPIKVKKCGDRCSLVRCAGKTADQCTKSEVFLPRDGDCRCCDTCVPKENAPILDQKCKPDKCAQAKCRDVPSTMCFDHGLAFVPKDDCSCCDKCV